jgi:hypothetical protein
VVTGVVGRGAATIASAIQNRDRGDDRWARRQVRGLWRGRDVALVYTVFVVVISVVASTSTNLANLRQRPLSVLVASAFVISPVAGLWVLAPTIVAYGALQRWLGRSSTILVAVLGHVGATLFIAAIEITSITKGLVGFRIAISPDVGVSYGLAAVGGVLVARVTGAWQKPYVIASVIVVIGQLLLLRDFTGLGHATAWLIGVAIAIPISRATRAQPRTGS